MGVKNISGDLDVTGSFKINGTSLLNGYTITPVGQTSFYYESGEAYARFFLNITDTRVKAAKLLIFTMNNSFVVTPIAQNGDTLAAGNFAYNSDGDSMIARLRIQISTWESGTKGVVNVNFDSNFANAVSISPYAAILLVE